MKLVHELGFAGERTFKTSNVKVKLILKIHWTSLLKTMKGEDIMQASLLHQEE